MIAACRVIFPDRQRNTACSADSLDLATKDAPGDSNFKGGISLPKALKAGIVGAGYVSSYHVRAVQSLDFAEVVGITDPDRERARGIARQFGIPAVYTSLAELAAAGANVIHILTPPALHCRLTLEALELGCHVLVEKPMAETDDDCRRMMETARRKGLVLSVNHSARMDPIVLRALDMVRQGACGDLLGVSFLRSSDYPPYAGGPAIPAPFRNGSYPFQDLGVHGLYLLEAFLGEIRSADIRYYSTGTDPNLFFDEWRAQVECARGPAWLQISWNARPMQNEIVVHGTRGVMTVDCYLQTIVVRKTYPAPKPIQRIIGAWDNSLRTLVAVTGNAFRFVTGRLLPSPGIHLSVVKFYEALRAGSPPPVPPEEGRRIVSLMEEVSTRADAEKIERLAEKPPVRRPVILVTGSNGFLGSTLLARLRASGEPIRLLLRRPTRAFDCDTNIHLVYGDLGDPAAVDRAVDGVDLVYHVGAAMKGGPADFERGTIWGTRNIIESCLRHGVKRLVYVSSMSVLDQAGHRDGVTVDEKAPLEPFPEKRGLYTQTKLTAEAEVLAAVRGRGLSAVILRPGQIFGPGAETVSPAGTIGLGGRWVIVGSGSHPLPLVYVDDVVDALLLAADRTVSGELFQLVDSTTITQKEYAAAAQEKLGPSLRVVRMPTPVMMFLATAVEVLGKLLKRPLPLSRYRVRSLRPLWPCDSSAAATRLGWTPRVGVREGMRRTFHA
jgi:predicted dehydrogenase/nucleoside-diphosphate-sugar epimerase